MNRILLILLLCCPLPLCAQGSWQPVPGAPMAGRIDDITFINDSTGFISVFDSIYKTVNTGNTWNFIGRIDTVNGSSFNRSIEFVNDTVGFAGTILGFAFGGMYRTLDGGNSWTKLNIMLMDSIDGICGIDSDPGLLIAVGTFAGPGKFYKTTDIGSTWLVQDLAPMASGLVDCLIIDSLTYLVSGISDSATQMKATILKTIDGGITWTRVFLATGPQISYLWKMYLRPNGKGIGSIQHGPPAICITDDYGDSWSEHTVSVASIDYGGVALFNDTLGWVADQYVSYVWETHDGGLTWIQSNAMNSGNRMVIPDGNTVLASGETIYKYDFNTGTSPQVPASADFHRMHFIPNPGDKLVTIVTEAGRRTYGHLDVLSVDGKLVKHQYTGIFNAGKNNSTLDVSNFADGTYVVLWRNNERFISSVLKVVH